jgi:transmembrane sensor
MSGAEQKIGIKIPLGAQDVEARAAQFLVKRRNQANWDASDQIEFDAWLAQSLAHRTAYWRLEAVWERADRLSVLRSGSLAEDAIRPSHKRAMISKISAAVLAIAIVGAAADYLFSRPGDKIYSTPVGGHMAIKLADGSNVELNTDTVLRAEVTNRERSVTLVKGEAYFQIQHDPDHPFSVTVARRRIVDLGTKFLVRLNANRVEVALVEGRARIEAADATMQARAVELRPGDLAVATVDSMSVSKKTVHELADDLGWRRGVLVFHHMELADAVAEFNRYNNVKFIVVGPSIARLEIVGIFPANDTGLFGRAVKTVLGLNVERHGEEILISR